MTKHFTIYLLFSFVLLTNQIFAQLIIEAENYTDMNGVKTEGCSDTGGGINVGYIDSNDWLEYDININKSGNYTFSFRTAGEQTGKITINDNGTDIGSIDIPATGGWQTWQTIELTNINLNEGQRNIRIKANTGGFNLNWIKIFYTDTDNDIPTTPKIIEASATVHDIKLVWSKASDQTSGLAGYQILRDSVLYKFTTDTVLTLNKLAPNQEFNLAILATDMAGNVSEQATSTLKTDTLPWDLAWADEFDYTGKPNPDFWYYETGGHGWGNGEYQYYTAGDNADVKDGALIIEARKESHGGNDFTSTRLNSTQANDFLYGRIEVKAKLPKTKGSWPAIWTLPTEWIYGNWPSCGEIDIMEHSATYGYGYVFGTIHTGAYNHQDNTQQSGGAYYDDVTDTYHTYTIEWYPDHIDWYYDEVLVFTFENEYKTTEEWPYDIPHHLLLNVAVGGGLGGNVDYNGEWPQQMVVDYVRVYDFKLYENDTIAPTAPSNLTANAKWETAELNWKAGSDNYGIRGYIVYQDGEILDTVADMNYVVQNLSAETTYDFGVKTLDYASNTSETTTINVSTTEIESITVPGIVEAENYTLMEGIDTENCTEGGKNVGWTEANDWLTYTLNVTSDIDYKAAFRVAGEGSDCSVQLLDENNNILTSIDFTVSGGWQNWKTVVSESFTLPQGIQTIKLNIIKGGFNLNWIKLGDENYIGIKDNISDLVNIYPNPLSGNTLNVDLPFSNKKVNVALTTTDGRTIFKQSVIPESGKLSIQNKNWKKGIYFISFTTSEGTFTKPLEIQ